MPTSRLLHGTKRLLKQSSCLFYLHAVAHWLVETNTAHDEERKLPFFCFHIIPTTISYLVNRDILKMGNWGKVS